MAAGLAIITTHGTGCAEVVGETGILVPAKSANAIRDGLTKLLQEPNLCQQLGQAARRRFEKAFTWDIVAKRYGKVYEQFK